jgi:pyruvate,water dikinase
MSESLWITDTVPSARFPIYTRANSGEVYAGVLKPLGWTTSIGWPSEHGWRNALVRYGVFDIDEFDAAQPELVASFGGYIYLNLSAQRIVGARTPGVSPDDVDRAFFGDIGGAPRYVAAPGDNDPRYMERVGETLAWIMQARAVPEVDAQRDAVDRLRRERPELSAMSHGDIVAHIRWLLEKWYAPIISLHFFIISCATVPTGAIQSLTLRLGRPELAMRLLSGFGDVDSALPATAMHELADAAEAQPAVTQVMDDPTRGSRWQTISESADPAVRSFAEKVREFVRRFGSGGPDPYDVSVDSWETNPDLVLSAVHTMRGKSVHLGHRDGRLDRASALADVRHLFADSREELAQIEAAAAASAVWIPARERSKSTMTRLLNEVRVAVFELSRQATDRGVVDSINELAMLTLDELPLLDDDPAAVRALIAARTARHRELSAKAPPFFINGTVPPLSQWADREANDPSAIQLARCGETLHGVAASPGTATGIARIVTASTDVEIEDGAVLVAPYTDAGWTPLFLAAAAVVVEVGAPLSHAAIISRELGVPCVMSCPDATRRIAEGAKLTVDGTNGVVHVH